VTAGRTDTIAPLGTSAVGLRTALWAADPADPLWQVHVLQPVRFDGLSWRPLETPVVALTAGHARSP
jgi:hypothetical protein